LRLSIELKQLRRVEKSRWLRLLPRGCWVKMVYSSHTVLIIAITAPIVGLNSVERIKDVVAAVNLKLSEQEIKYLEEPYLPRPVIGISIPPLK
jgi:hypothetical protein